MSMQPKIDRTEVIILPKIQPCPKFEPLIISWQKIGNRSRSISLILFPLNDIDRVLYLPLQNSKLVVFIDEYET